MHWGGVTIYKRGISVFFALLLFFTTSPVLADTQNCNEAELRNKGIVALNCSGDQPLSGFCSMGSSSSINLAGNDNVEKTFRFFVAKGLTPDQAAGIVGNAAIESGVNPKSVSKNGKYSGMFQWDTGGRFANLKRWTASQGLDPLSLDGQLAYAWYEATSRGNIIGIQKQPSVDLASWFWGRFFEVAVVGGSSSTTPLTNVQALDKRIANARAVLAKFGGSVTPVQASSPDQPAPAAPTQQEGGCIGGNGTNTQFVDGFIVYSQYDPVWKNSPYGSSTVGVAGCGPSAMAMIITNITHQRVTPVDTANYAASKGLYIDGEGSSWSIGPVLAQHWSLKSEPVGNNKVKIVQALQAGKLVIAAGHGPEPFTTGGHFIVIRGVTASGKFKVGDSGHSNTSDKEWDPDQIISHMSGGSAYAIFQ